MKSTLLNLRHILLIMNLLFFIAGPVTATSAADATPTVLEKVSLQLSWKHQFQFAGFYTAIEQGYFAEQGLEVEIREFQEGADPIVEVPAGRADFGIYSDELIFDRMEGRPVVLLANYFKRFPLVFLAQPGLKNLADLKGKRLMISSKGARSMTVRAAFHKVGLIPGENLELVPSSFDIGSLVRGEVDAMTAFRSNEPFVLDQQNIPYEMIEIDNALPGLGDINLFTSEKQATQHPERTRSFVSASNRGWQYALDHPNETVDLILKKYTPHANREALLFEAEKTRELMLPDKYPIGAIIDEHVHSVVQGLMSVVNQENVVHLQGLLFESKLRNWQRETLAQPKNELNLTPDEQNWISNHPLIHAAIINAPPYQFQENGPRGISVDLLNRIAAKAGFQVEYLQSLNRPDALEDIRNNKKTDLLLAAERTREQDSFLTFSEEYLELPGVIFTRQDESIILGFEDLYGKTIAVEKNCLIQERLAREYPQIKQLLVADASEALAAVSKNQADAYVGNLTVAQYHIANRGFSNLKVAAPSPFGNHTLRFAIRNDWPQLATILNKGLAGILPEERNAITRKYFTVKIEQSANYQRLWWLLSTIMVVAFLILLWNRTLRRKVAESTVQLRQELALRHQSEARYRRVIDSLEHDYVFYTLDPDGVITYISPAVTSILGYAPEECMVHYSNFVPDVPGNQQSVVKIERSLRGEKLPPFAGKMWHKEGRVITYEAILNPIFDDQGKVIALECMLHDITERT